MSEEKGIKELNEVFDALDVVAEFAGGILSNGKIGPEDIDDLVGLATKFGTLQEGVKGAKEALEEGKDLDQSEVLALIGRVYQTVEKFASAKK